MATTTKTSRKPSGRKPAARKTQTTKRTPSKAKTTTTPTPERKPRTGQVPEFSKAAHAASALITVDENGKPNKRAPLGTVQLQRVHNAIGKRKPADVLRLLVYGGPSFKRGQTQRGALDVATGWASSKIGQTDLPEGCRARFTAFAAEIGDPRKHKINGKALAAALVGLVQSPPK
jgi:hypothetical protein